MGGQAAWEEARATPISSEGGRGALAHSPLRVAGGPSEPVPAGGSQQRLYSAQPKGLSVFGS